MPGAARANVKRDSVQVHDASDFPAMRAGSIGPRRVAPPPRIVAVFAPVSTGRDGVSRPNRVKPNRRFTIHQSAARDVVWPATFSSGRCSVAARLVDRTGSRPARPTATRSSLGDHGREREPNDTRDHAAWAVADHPRLAGRDSGAVALHRDGNFIEMGLPTRETTESGWYRVRGGAFAATAMLVLTACGGGSTIAGHITAASSSSAPAATSSPAAAQLDPGNFPTTPQPPMGTAGTEFVGKLLDAQRMAGFVIGPWEVDPRLNVDYPSGPMVLKESGAIFGVGAPQAVTDALDRHGFVNGFTSSRQVDASSNFNTILRNSVIRFADPAAAAAAAADTMQAESQQSAGGSLPNAVVIPGHPDALATNYTWTQNDTHVEWKTNIVSFTPHGPYVLLQQVESTDSLEAGLAIATKTLDLQIPLIDKFTPTAATDFPTLPRDPSGQLARTLMKPEKGLGVTENATYDRRGQLQFDSNPVATSQVFDQTGTDLSTRGLTTVYRAADAASAGRVVDAFAGQAAPLTKGAVTPVSGVPGSRCQALAGSGGTYCLATADRFAIELTAAQPAAATQMLTAQYLMLMAR